MTIERPLAASDVAAIFDALSQVTRLEAYRLLRRYHPFGLAAGDIARLLAVPHNTLSTHLAALQACRLIQSRREGRTVIFAAIPDRLLAAQSYAANDRPPKFKATPKPGPTIYPAKRSRDAYAAKAYNVLVLCTHNSVRSILAEAIISREGLGRFCAFSAGSRPKARPNAESLTLLSDLGYETKGLRSKSWTEFARAAAPRMDFIITVCDVAAGERCPHWPGHPLSVHWGIPDPTDAPGTKDQRRAALQDAYRQLMNRTTAFVNLPIDQLSFAELKARLAAIGRMEGATELTLSGEAA